MKRHFMDFIFPICTVDYNILKATPYLSSSANAGSG
jgi:hypothetical protein